MPASLTVCHTGGGQNHGVDVESPVSREARKAVEAGREKIDHAHLNGHPTRRLPGTLSVCFEYVEGEGIILGLDMAGVAVSSGSACTSGSLEPSHVLLAMGVHPAVAQASIRFSLGRENSEEDVDSVIESLPPIVERLRAMSMFSVESPFSDVAGPRRRG